MVKYPEAIERLMPDRPIAEDCLALMRNAIAFSKQLLVIIRKTILNNQ
ncbi:hypothetical protein [Tychonema sp. LEGE 07203]|nr:hypothetical protein [Tychonema sp. LEGE 07203]MBE9093185.1 hypothetical protein [Tychonema sp. LEGE 07203]